MPFNSPLPEWNNSGTEPPQSKKDAGWQPSDKPPADWWNWFQYTAYNALLELQQYAAHKDEISSPPDASITVKGITQLSNAVTSTEETKAATPNAVKKAYDKAVSAEEDIIAHSADGVQHITAAERTAWNAKETIDGSRKKVEQTDFKVFKSGKDANGVFTTVDYKRQDDTLALKSVLSGGTSPNYTTRTITYYGLNGTTVEKTTTRTLSYDADGVLISEV
ncbi:tail fiber protein [Fictibacillus sp. 18YEL24]|uniref:tail fiber protein n=1 Tax=Fictibacillus sp. 18YEL24 TaxID=2745875 RepID=UPI0018CF62CF|nr:phage tail protein [Fictibacillus sp. 18YEL24]MBH0171011.1 tail fiber protein [Fictibacillus sp. 18YEL24]